MNRLSLLTILVPMGNAKKIVKYSKNQGITGATVLLATGTVKSKVLDFFGISETRKELILILGEDIFLDNLMNKLDSKFKITKTNFGIAFSFAVSFTNSTKLNIDDKFECKRENKENMKSAIFTIVNRGKASEVVDVSLKAGAKGGTILHGRGSGLNQSTTLFNMVIEPEKEIVLTIVDDEKLETVVQSIRQNTDVEKEGQGILFVLPVSKAYGVK